MNSIDIIEFESRYTQELKDLVYLVLGHVGIKVEKYTTTSRDTDLDYIEKIYKERGRFWLAFKDNKLIGCIAIEEKDLETAKLKRMFVLPEFHGSGAGQALLDKALSFAKSNTYHRVVLNTDKLMNRAHRFYEKNEFKKIGEDEERLFYELILD